MSYTNEALERVEMAINDILAGCETMDDYHEWEDIASSSISSVLEELDEEQFRSTCDAFMRYIRNIAEGNHNLAYGVRAALIRAMNENIDYLDIMGSDEEDTLIPIMRDVIIEAEGMFEEG